MSKLCSFRFSKKPWFWLIPGAIRCQSCPPAQEANDFNKKVVFFIRTNATRPVLPSFLFQRFWACTSYFSSFSCGFETYLRKNLGPFGGQDRRSAGGETSQNELSKLPRGVLLQGGNPSDSVADVATDMLQEMIQQNCHEIEQFGTFSKSFTDSWWNGNPLRVQKPLVCFRNVHTGFPHVPQHLEDSAIRQAIHRCQLCTPGADSQRNW